MSALVIQRVIFTQAPLILTH